MSKIHIISSGTGVGKTLIPSLLCKYFNDKKINYIATKPIVSGFKLANKNEDLYQIINAENKKYSLANVKRHSAHLFKFPLSPDQAAEKEKVNYATVKTLSAFIKKHDKKYDKVLIEGVGGVCVPLNRSETYLDYLIKDFNKKNDKIILVLGSYLGSLSHSITTLKTLENSRLNPAFIVVTQSLKKDCELYIDIAATIKSLSNFTSVNIIGLDNLTKRNEAKALKVFYERISKENI